MGEQQRGDDDMEQEKEKRWTLNATGPVDQQRHCHPVHTDLDPGEPLVDGIGSRMPRVPSPQYPPKEYVVGQYPQTQEIQRGGWDAEGQDAAGKPGDQEHTNPSSPAQTDQPVQAADQLLLNQSAALLGQSQTPSRLSQQSIPSRGLAFISRDALSLSNDPAMGTLGLT